MKRRWSCLFVLTAGLAFGGCVPPPANQPNNNLSSPAPAATVSPSPPTDAAHTQSLTLPVLDAFFADESFAETIKTRLHLTDDQVTKLKGLARSETAKLDDENAGREERQSATARAAAAEKIGALIGEEKTQQLAQLVGELWRGPADEASDKSAQRTDALNSVPKDSRIVVNIPAYRMDVFDSGRLIKSYKIGIGYPEFPLPIGQRKAGVIIFNPSWTPPDEPWVAKMKNVSAGEKVPAGSKLNPLGPIKIPIGGPSLIHGGKSPAKLGTFASHGCVGLTTPQVQDFARILAQLGGAELTEAQLADYARSKTETKQVKLERAMPVDLRYETIVVEDGKLHVYRDVYDQGTNTEENLRAVLAANGVRLEDLTEAERTQALAAIAQMSAGSGAGPKESPSAEKLAQSKTNASKKMNAPTKNQKEIVIEIAALQGKGYPAPVAFDTGSGKTKATAPKAEKR
jgi:lipoprotein-anchoring transpeptidase ErfK/SrfK